MDSVPEVQDLRVSTVRTRKAKGGCPRGNGVAGQRSRWLSAAPEQSSEDARGGLLVLDEEFEFTSIEVDAAA